MTRFCKIYCQHLENQSYDSEKGGTTLGFRENLELYGALKRLVEWNGALVSVVTEGVTDMTVLRQWVDMLSADVKAASDVRASHLLWRGSINVTSTDTVRIRVVIYVFY